MHGAEEGQVFPLQTPYNQNQEGFCGAYRGVVSIRTIGEPRSIGRKRCLLGSTETFFNIATSEGRLLRPGDDRSDIETQKTNKVFPPATNRSGPTRSRR